MTLSVGFKAVSHPDAQILILGSLPGTESLKQHQYYAKKQNSFWKIMGELFGASPDIPYQDRLSKLIENKIALWDVCAAAERAGSLDSNIKSPVVNDFVKFFKKHTSIKHVYFNGQPAEKLFARHVKPRLLDISLTYSILPSTSPAHAGMRYEQKLSLWKQALK